MQTDALTFAWPIRRWFQGKLLLFFGVSALLHGSLFLLFQVVHREKVTAPERERELQILSRDIPEHRILLEAVEAEVPLGALSHQLLPVDELLQKAQHFDFVGVEAQPKQPERWRPVAQVSPPSFRRQNAPKPAHEFAEFPGAIQLSDGLKARLADGVEVPGAPGGKIVKCPVYWIGVDGAGTVQFVHLQSSSGDEESDRLGENVLRHLSFTGGETNTVWGEATLQWRQQHPAAP